MIFLGSIGYIRFPLCIVGLTTPIVISSFMFKAGLCSGLLSSFGIVIRAPFFVCLVILLRLMLEDDKLSSLLNDPP